MRSATGVVLVVAAMGCGNGEEPEDTAGAYVLTAVNEAGLPYQLPMNGDCEEFVESGELQMTAAGSYFIEFRGPFECPDAEPGVAGRTYVGSYRVSGSELRFETALAGGELIQFEGRFEDGVVRATVPPLPPAEGPELALRFEPAP